MDDIAGLGKAAREITKAIQPFSEPVLREIGEFVAARIRLAHLPSTIRAARRAQEKLRAAGLDARAVPLKTLLPILEGAALESNDSSDIVELWAGLLASASAGDDVLPAYARLLADLSPEEARVLDFIATNERPSGVKGGPENEPILAVSIPSLIESSGFTSSAYAVRMQNLERLGLVDQVSAGGMGSLQRFAGDSTLGQIGLTPLGRGLIAACRGPRAAGAIPEGGSE